MKISKQKSIRLSNGPLGGVKQIGSNMTEVQHGDLTVLYSYETPVAFLSSQGGYRTEKKWSVTTAKHIGKFFAHHGYDAKGAFKIPQDELERFVEQGTSSGLSWKGNPRRSRRERYVLVYQAGIANVFRVTSFNLSDYGRDAERLVQSDFRTAEAFARGLAAAGGIVKSAACNRAGDIAREKWTDDLDEQPFSDKFQPVDSSKGLSIND
jgi:hypothetical protein